MACNCQPTKPCDNSCKMNSKDVCYTGIDLTCIDIFPLSHTVENYLIKIDEILCQLLNAANVNYGILTLNANGQEVGTFAALGAIDTVFNINLDNVGLGAQIFKAYNPLTDSHELKSITKTGDLIVITENLDDIEITIDEDELGNFLEENQKTYSLDNVGGGAEIYLTPDDLTLNNTEFNLRTLNTNSLQITTVGDEIFIDEVPLFQGTDYYVNNNYPGVEEKGTPSKPFKTLLKCVDKILNRGSQTDPAINGGLPYEKWDLRNENQNIRVIVQSYAETLENLAINGVTYFLERGGFASMIQLGIGSTTDYIVDMKELVDNVPKVSGALPYNLTCAIIGKGTLAIQEGHTTRRGFVRAFGHNNGITNADQPDSQFSLGDNTSNINCIMYRNPTLPYINLTNDRELETRIYSGTMPITVSKNIVSIDFLYINGILANPLDYSFVNDEITITAPLVNGDQIVVAYTIVPENINRELIDMLGYQTTSVPDYGAVEFIGSNAIFRESLFLEGNIVIACYEQHMLYGDEKGTLYGETGSVYLRRNLQFVNYNTIQYSDINGFGIPNIRKFYTPSEHISDIYLKNGAAINYAGKFTTQENTGATQGGSEAFITVESGAGVGELSAFTANGGGIIFNLLYNHYIKIINQSSFGAYSTSTVSAKNLRMESAVFEEVISIVDETGADYTDLIYPLVLQNCTLQNKFVYGNIRMPFINMIINSNVFIRGGIISLVDTIMNSDTPEFANNAAAVAALLPIGSYYKDSNDFLKVVN